MPLLPINRKRDWINTYVISLFPFREELLEFLISGSFIIDEEGFLTLKVFKAFPETGEVELHLSGELFNDSLGRYEKVECVRRYGVLL